MKMHQINYDQLEEYSKEFAQRLGDYFFIDHSHIEGKDILKLCDIKQVNLLVVKNLFEKWQAETTRLKSPFFDYQHPKVQEALDSFMNTLSQHIRIQKQHFIPLLKKAAHETLLLIIAPKDFYLEQIKKTAYQPVNAEKFQAIQKYIHYNKELLKAYIARLSQHDAEGVSTDRAITLLDEVYDNNQGYIEPIEWRLKNFSDIVALDSQRLFIDQAPKLESVAEEATQYLPKSSVSNPSSALPTTSKPLPEEKTSEEKKYPKTLNDVMKGGASKPNILEQYQQARISNIRSVISLNQKFQFINHLFGGDSFAFNDAINKIEQAQSKEAVRQEIREKYALKYNWDFETEEVQEFMTLIERRFD